MSDAELSSQLKAALCDSFGVRDEGDGRWAVRTPFTFDDGDTLPLFIELFVDGTWRITDDGIAASHLFFDEFQFTEARLSRIEMLVEASGAEIDANRALSLRLGGPPTAFDIGDFVQLLAQVQGVALTSRVERDQTRYISAVRSRIEQRLTSPDFAENWSPVGLRDTKAAYRADLRIVNDDLRDVVLFVASTSDKASVSTLCVHQFGKVLHNFVPLLAYHPDRVSSEAVFRFQDEVQNDLATVPTRPDATAELERALRLVGVGLTEAS